MTAWRVATKESIVSIEDTIICVFNNSVIALVIQYVDFMRVVLRKHRITTLKGLYDLYPTFKSYSVEKVDKVD